MRKERIIFIISLITMIISSIISVYAASYLYNSNEVSYNNTSSGITSDNVQGAIDELYTEATNYAQIREMIYPVGSIYISVEDDTVAKVQARFGGTWESFASGRTLVGVGTGTDANSTSQTFAINETNGEYTHKLTVDEMPSHSHNTFVRLNKGSSGAPANSSLTGASYWWNMVTIAGGYDNGVVTVGPTGGNGYHNNIQPYITVYMYKRTA